MLLKLITKVSMSIRFTHIAVTAAALGLLAACSLTPMDQVETGERKITAPSEYQVKKLIEKKLASKSASSKVLGLDVAETWFDGHGRFGIICKVKIDNGPPIKPFIGYERIRVRFMEVLLEQRLEEWRIKRMTPLGRVHLLPAFDT